MRSYRRSAAAAAAILVAGCSLQPVYHRPGAPVSPDYPSGEAYKPVGTEQLPAPDIGWRNFLLDARLRRLVELALRNNRNLRVAVLNVELVRAQYHFQRAALYPQLNLSASAAKVGGPGRTGAVTTAPGSTSPGTTAGGSTTATGTTTTFAVDLTAAWELDFFGRLRSLTAAARDQYLASNYARQAFHILLVSQVADQYLTVLAFDSLLVVTRNTLTAAQESYKLVKLQFDTGTASELDLTLAQSTVEIALANLAAQIRLRAQAENALVLLVGQPLPKDMPPPVPLEAQSILADIPAGLPSDLLTRRPDILQAEAILRAENANIGAARAAFFPSIALTGDLGTVSSRLGGLFAGGSSAWTFIPSLIQPLFNGGANRATLDIAVVQRDIGVAQYQNSIQVAFSEVANGLAARGTYDDQLAALQRDTNVERRRLELANMLYVNGIDTYLDVLTAQTALYTAQVSTVTARLNRLTNLVDLYRALGGGWLVETNQPSTGGKSS